MIDPKEKYIQKVIHEIHFSYDHKTIKKELMNHINDLETGLTDGLLTDDQVKNEMGDPVELGKALNQIHKPILGYLWLISKYSVLIVFIYFLGNLYQTHQNARLYTQEYSDAELDLSYLFDHYGEAYTAGDLIDFDIHEIYQLGQNKIILERVVLHPKGKLALIYQEIRPYYLFNAASPLHHLNLYSKISLENQDVIEADGFGNLYFGYPVLFFDFPNNSIESFEFKYQESIHEITYHFEVKP